MKEETTGGEKLNAMEAQFMARLREHPELLARFQSILDLTCTREGQLQTADEVEALLIRELRQLGHTSMNQWATQAEQRVSEELKGQDVTLRSRKKKR
jgi:hypothetical protein